MYVRLFVKVKGQSIIPVESKDKLHVTMVLHTNGQFSSAKFSLLKSKPTPKILIKRIHPYNLKRTLMVLLSVTEARGKGRKITII